tara:strand:+ start:347 stop:721 length:375 start_codon:yes stop_codon:yes gene_type:complete
MYKHFKLEEFDSPDQRGSGKHMNREFMEMLDEAREIADIPFKINSGFRTEAYQEDLRKRGYKTSKTKSPHEKGVAADIHVVDSTSRWLVINSLLLAGFTRIGIADTFIHVDLDLERRHSVVWTY